MIEVICASDCPFCIEQLEIMKGSFFEDEYRVFDAGHRKFASYPNPELADEGVPCVVIRGEDGVVRFAHNGVIDGDELREAERKVKRAYYFPS